MNRKTVNDYRILLFFTAFIWLLEIANLIFDHQLNQFALQPRQVSALPGIVTMHFLHWNLFHIISNSIPLLILGFFVCSVGKGIKVTISIMLISGALVWLFARNGLHAGASGLVMGYWGYLISNAVFDRSLKNIFFAILTIAFYGGIVFSLIDFREHVSFEGHIFGFLAGVMSAWIWRDKANHR
ncbi:rhomboid family intramembrane serine protease [Aliikangiella coralliicola]|uniref:Rhomboid family intramembrane serine protease n=1 Tax=Aliikangiella coralliicola TaxID=2592383 RepID=A0A545UIP0_9GAMM|nr:rhomboid family intramembrane serine protease [Aliikangiella coralliicola]TQV89293.1 rhomboid family intramembrane serine protease [Aliikangiella coralliicola]